MTRPITIAILAMGGEGGGVLADWLIDLGEHNGFVAQGTSVPGVAQRTGATIYYVELFPAAAAAAAGARPVLALMPLPGDVDVVVASELMEAGRAVQRGLVTADRTTLITSTHRVYAIGERSAPGDGRIDGAALLAHAQAAARRFIRFDMAEVAERHASVISAVMFGALAGADVLPFTREQFEATIEHGGVGVKASRAAFATAFANARMPVVESTPGESVEAVAPAPSPSPSPAPAPAPSPSPPHPAVAALVERITHAFPPPLHPVLLQGARRLVDYQDPAWAQHYLDRMAPVVALPDGDDFTLALTVARHLALAMSYEDTIRVADLKTRDSRFARVHAEVKVDDGQLAEIAEFLHPRAEEIAETVPAPLGRWLLGTPRVRAWIDRATARGTTLQTTTLRGFLMLRAVAALRPWRRTTLRHAAEEARIEAWLAAVARAVRRGPALAVEVAACQRLLKGYGDTHARGVRKFDTIMAVVSRHADVVTPDLVRTLRDAALADEAGTKLDAALSRLGWAV